MATETDPHASLRLLQLVSPSLPVGAFAYSQGLEWAVEAGWVKDETDTLAWCREMLGNGIARVDIPILQRLHRGWMNGDPATRQKWNRQLLALRETSELREEERVRGRALSRLLEGLQVAGCDQLEKENDHTQLSAFAFAATTWNIPVRDAALGHAWSWLENTVMAALKLVPLGQLAGQRLLLEMSAPLQEAVEGGLQLADEDIGLSLPGATFASARHETQYTRLFRS